MVNAPRIGEIYMVDFGDPVGHEQGYQRPAVIISPERLNRTPSRIAIAMAVTSRDRGVPYHLPLDVERCGLERPSWVRTEDIRTVAHERLKRYIGRVSGEELDDLRDMLITLLEL
ncbi:type II toxin-antitoxin system PemK/MazF family toxin [Phytomonospora endophytica]|uniref:mRNA interferase n=1 Tax=Phytomonospora endophytica TaxID=714109 RepID=A0A841G0U2_9ACTN|nr:type II toxin-antitoxin system PemK/MazF family toxin [Phytomonospora endophytica]MBB6038299.1 mRNA interferase MazF [Phytomonospora endophytica]GIG64229.1 endoribonuclease MazF9 [Phytomonospora endophytica]